MIDFYVWYTSNARKVAIMLEETGLDYTLHEIDIGRGYQFDAEFLAISPNNKIPAITDHDGPDGGTIALFESGAILLYLAEKTGRYLPAAGTDRYEVVQWLMFQMGGVGPMFGQYNHFHAYAREDIPYARDRYAKECGRLYRVMDTILGQRDYMAGEYSVADMALYPWACNFEARGQDPEEVPHVKAWAERVGERPAVRCAIVALDKKPRPGPIDDEHWENMYGATQYVRR